MQVADLWWAQYAAIPDTRDVEWDLDPTYLAVDAWLGSGDPVFADFVLLLLERAPREQDGWHSYWELSALRRFLQATDDRGRSLIQEAATTNLDVADSLAYLRERRDI